MNKSELRSKIESLFRTDSALEALCIDYFPSVYKHFSSGMDRVQKVNLLLTSIDANYIETVLRNAEYSMSVALNGMPSGNSLPTATLANTEFPHAFSEETSRKDPMQKNHALVIGISNYQYINKLPKVDDMKDIVSTLTNPHQCGYPVGNVEVLEDDKATWDEIFAALGRLAQRCDSDSTVFLYFTGHGGRIETGPHAGEYLLPVNVDCTDGGLLERTAISGEQVTRALGNINASKMLVVFDCCHAGGIGQPKTALSPLLTPGLSAQFYLKLHEGKGRVVFASSRSTEVSYIMHGDRHSLFTKHFLAGLQGGAASEDGMIRVFNLFDYIQPLVTQENPDQHPIFKANQLESNFPVAMYLGGRKGGIQRDADGFRYDAYVSYVDSAPDSEWVWKTLVPRLERAGLKLAVSNDVEGPGVARVVGVERAMSQARRTIVVLSDRYLTDSMADFENVMGQTMGLQEGQYRLVPVQFAPVTGKVPMRLGMLTTLDLAHPYRTERAFDRLVQALKEPAPKQLRTDPTRTYS